jgi:hypothetical protein
MSEAKYTGGFGMVVIALSYHLSQIFPTVGTASEAGGIIGILKAIFNMLLRSISVIHISDNGLLVI